VSGADNQLISVKNVPKVTKNAVLALMMPIIILGGILSGQFTPTEAAAVAVVYAFVVGKVRFSAVKLFGKTLGIIGCGKIGQALAKMAKAIGLSVIAYDPYVAVETMATLGIEKSDLDYLLQNSDIISLHLPHTKETHYLIGTREISVMKRQAILINVARGGIVDEFALAEALQTGKLYGAGLDVLEAEPSIKDNPLLACDNIIITPHMAWKSEVAAEALEMAAVREVRSVLLEDKPINLVNRQLIKQ
jgi:D-3-phosphoglycerate dehydrogenase